MLVIVAPGQGAQRPGMLAPWAALPLSGELLRNAGLILGADLLRLDRDASSATRYAQELLVALGHAGWCELVADRPRTPHAVAGHSVGELTVAAVGGAMAADDALRVTRRRAEAMRAAAASAPGGLLAVTAVGRPRPTAGEPLTDAAREIDDLVARAATSGLSVSVVNGPSQIVLGGPDSGLERFVAAHRADGSRRTRLTRLDVDGAFHTHAMASAASEVETRVAELPPGPNRPLPVYVRGADGRPVDGPALVASLPAQVASPVRWDLVMARLADIGATGVLELPPAGTLTALVSRAHPQVDTFALRAPADLAAARDFVDDHLHR